jgi:preprotein translocase subunit SecG
MSILYILLTVLMFLDCVLLVFLVLLQLPKKEAGAGMAFGGAATDALFGAGSGNVLTKITKYVAGIFFGLAIILAIMASHKPQSGAASLAQKMMQGTAVPLTAPAAPPATSSATPGSTGLLELTNLPPAAPPATPPAAGQPRAVSNAPAPAPAKGTNK